LHIKVVFQRNPQIDYSKVLTMKKMKFLIFACLAFSTVTLLSTNLSAQQARTGKHVNKKASNKLQTMKMADGNLIQLKKATPTSSTQKPTIKSKSTTTGNKKLNLAKQPASLSSIKTTKKSGQGSRIIKGKKFTFDTTTRDQRIAKRRANAKKIDINALKSKIKKQNQ